MYVVAIKPVFKQQNADVARRAKVHEVSHRVTEKALNDKCEEQPLGQSWKTKQTSPRYDREVTEEPTTVDISLQMWNKMYNPLDLKNIDCIGAGWPLFRRNDAVSLKLSPFPVPKYFMDWTI